MAANALVQARIDRAVKDEAAAVLAAMGLAVSDAVRLPPGLSIRIPAVNTH